MDCTDCDSVGLARGVGPARPRFARPTEERIDGDIRWGPGGDGRRTEGEGGGKMHREAAAQRGYGWEGGIMKPPRGAVVLPVASIPTFIHSSFGNPQIPSSLLQCQSEFFQSSICRNLICSRWQYRQPQYLASDMDHIDTCKLDAQSHPSDEIAPRDRPTDCSVGYSL